MSNVLKFVVIIDADWPKKTSQSMLNWINKQIAA